MDGFDLLLGRVVSIASALAAGFLVWRASRKLLSAIFAAVVVPVLVFLVSTVLLAMFVRRMVDDWRPVADGYLAEAVVLGHLVFWIIIFLRSRSQRALPLTR